MELDDLKPNWKKAGSQSKSPAELQLMTRVQNHPSLNRIRRKLIIESIFITAFLMVYNNIFDGGDKPLWVNIFLIVSAVLFVLNDLSAYLVLEKPVSGESLALSIRRLGKRLHWLLVSSVSTSLLFGGSLILFLSAGIEFSQSKYLLLAGIIVSLLALTYVSYRNWSFRISQVNKVAGELQEPASI